MDTKIHLCNTCMYSFPKCPADNSDIQYGNGVGNDNVIHCHKHELLPIQKPSLSKDTSFVDIAGELVDLYTAKNSDYGNSFSDLFAEFGILSPIIKLSDKLSRIKTLAKQEAKVTSESMEDTLRDLANYAIMTIAELRRNNRV